MRMAMKTPLRRLLRVLSIPCLLAVSGSAVAQDIATAEALFNKGREDLKAGRYETACKAFAESQRLDPRPGTLFSLATCEAEWGHIATAVTRYGDYITLYERMPEDKRADPIQTARYEEAKAMRDKLLPDVAQLTLVLAKGVPAGTVVKRDGEVVSDAALGLALPVDPGEHVVTTQMPGGRVVEQRLTISKGEKKSVTLEVEATPPVRAPAPPAAKNPPPPAPPPPSRSYVGPIVAFGAGAVGLGIGAGLGAVVLGKQSELNEACPNKNCPESERGNLDGAKTLSHVSTAGFALAGAGVVLGAVLLLLPAPQPDKSKKISIRLGVGYAGFTGTF